MHWYAYKHSLSGQETRLLECTLLGISDEGAADELNCTRSTVGTYWKRIFHKTGHRPQREVLSHLLRMVLASRTETIEVALQDDPGSFDPRAPRIS